MIRAGFGLRYKKPIGKRLHQGCSQGHQLL